MGDLNRPPKRVKHFTLPDQKTTLIADDGYEFFEEYEYLGDRSEIWIVSYNKEGKEVNRFNCRYIMGIEYA